MFQGTNIAPRKDNNTEVSTSDIKVTHLGSQHQGDGMVTRPDELKATAESEFRVAKYLLNHPDTVIVSERPSFDYTPEVLQGIKESGNFNLHTIAMSAFPQGLPENFSQLTDFQQEFLAREGGDRTLFVLGKVTHIYAAVDGEKRKELDAIIKPQLEGKSAFEKTIAIATNPELKKAVEERRESATLDKVEKLTKGKSSADVTIIFGSGHNFQDEFSNNKYDFSTISLMPESSELSDLNMPESQSRNAKK